MFRRAFKVRSQLSIILTISVISTLLIAGLHSSAIVKSAPMDGVKIVGFMGDGSSIGELDSVFSILEIWGCETSIAGLTSIVTPGDPGAPLVTPDLLISDVNVSEYDCVFVTGGDPSNLAENDTVLDKIRLAFSENIILSAICHGPIVFVEADVINGTRIGGSIELRTAVNNAGGIFVDDEDAVVDNGFVTADYSYNFPIAYGIGKLLGYYEMDPPLFSNIFFDQVEGLYRDTFTVGAQINDENNVAEAIAKVNIFREDMTTYLIKTIDLIDNGSGFFEGSFTLNENGTYSIDFRAKDDFYTYGYLLNYTTFAVEVQEQPITTPDPTETGEVGFIFILPSIFMFLTTSFIILSRKKKKWIRMSRF
jgi:protease I